MHLQVLDFHHGELLNPIARGSSAHLGGDFVQMLWCDAEFPCVIGYSPMFSVGSRLQQSDESRHDIGRPLSGFLAFEQSGVSTHDIKIKGSHSLQHSLLPVVVRRMFTAESNILEVVLYDSKRVALQLEDGVHEQMKPSADAITAARHATGLLLGWQEKLKKLAIRRGRDVSHMACHRYHATTHRELMLAAREMEPASSGCAKQVQNLLLHDVF